MKQPKKLYIKIKKIGERLTKTHFFVIAGVSVFFLMLLVINVASSTRFFTIQYDSAVGEVKGFTDAIKEKKVERKPLDTALYDKKNLAISNNPIPKSVGTSTASSTSLVKTPLYPVKTPYPNAGAMLPFQRIVAYYGNFYSTRMGALGEYPGPEMLRRLNEEVVKWEKADPETPVVPAIHYIATTAQGSAGKDGLYMLRMPDTEIDKALALGKQANGIVFLDIQVGHSSFQKEIPLLEKYLKLPNVHLALDPEFSMKNRKPPGEYMGAMDASDINYAIQYLSKLVKDNDLPPKVLVIHRFTNKMVTNYKQIKLTPEVQFVMHMDGWGPKANKIGTYNRVVVPEPVQFTGFKIFYKHDLKPPSTGIFSPSELLKLSPQPMYIQYQ